MAAPQAQQETPTFKLVLVGDGGTGKVNLPQAKLFAFLSPSWAAAEYSLAELPRCLMRGIMLTRNFFRRPLSSSAM